MRRLVLYVTLPASLFLTFLRVSVEPRYLLVVIPVFVACVVVLLRPLVGRVVRVRSPLLPFLLTGFEAGMIGYAIYGSVYGVDQLYRFAIVDIGQVTFVFFVLVTALGRLAPEMRRSLGQTAIAFARTPVSPSPRGSSRARSASRRCSIDRARGGRATTLRFLSAMTTPLITLVIGATTRISAGALGLPRGRWPFGWRLGRARARVRGVRRDVLGLDPLFAAAIFTMAVLPAPFVIPLYMPEGRPPTTTTT